MSSPAVDVSAARSVVLDLVERAAELEDSTEGEMCRLLDSIGGGFTAPPAGHGWREEYERFCAACGLGRTGVPPRVRMSGGDPRPAWSVASGRWVKTPTGRAWSGERVTFEDCREIHDDLAGVVRLLLEVRRFCRELPTDQELAAGWDPPVWLALEEGEAEILAGVDYETGLPAPVADWLSRLVHVPKRDWARAYCAHRLFGDPAPADTGEGWISKARKRADHVLRELV